MITVNSGITIGETDKYVSRAGMPPFFITIVEKNSMSNDGTIRNFAWRNFTGLNKNINYINQIKILKSEYKTKPDNGKGQKAVLGLLPLEQHA